MNVALVRWLQQSGAADRPVVLVHKGVRVEIPRLDATAEAIRAVIARIDRGEPPEAASL